MNTIIKDSSPTNQWLIFFGILALLLLCYSPILNPSYAMSDDYYFLAKGLREKDWFTPLVNVTVLQGRPFTSLTMGLAICCIHKISDYAYLRLFSLFLAVCLSFSSYFLLLKAGWSKIQSFCLALCFLTIPAFQVLISWAMASLYVLPGLMAYFAAMLTNLSIQSKPEPKSRLYFWVGTLCLFIAIGLYQPCAMLFWLFTSIILFDRRKSLSEKIQPTIAFFSTFFIATAIDIGIFEWAKHHFGTASVLPQRSHFCNHIAGKISWFINDPLTAALNFSRLNPSPKLAILVCSFILIGLSFYFKGNLKERFIQILFALFLIPLSYLPNLAIAENFGTYRTQAALAPLIIYYVFMAAAGIFETITKPFASSLLTIFAMSTCTLSLCAAYYNIDTFLVTPQMLELTLMKSQLDGQFGPKRQANPWTLKRDESFAPFSRYDEFGLPSLSQPWVPEPVTFLLRNKA